MAMRLNDRERSLLRALLEKGPALPLELATRTLSFPDEVASSIRGLADRGLIEIEPLARGRVGGELVFLSERGHQQLNHDDAEEALPA